MTEDAPGETTVQKLPILGTAGTVYTTAFGLRGHFIKAASIPLFLSIALQQVIGFEIDEGFLGIAGYLLDLIPYTMFAVAWHRLVLLGPESATTTFVPRWESRNWRFLIYLAILELIVVISPILMAEFSFGGFELADSESEDVGEEDYGLLSLAIDLVFYVSVLLSTLLILTPLIYFWTRFSFVLPATALDQNFGFVRSWRETRLHGLRLTALMLLISTPFYAVLLALYSALPDECSGNLATSGTAGDFGLGCFAIDSFPVTVIENVLYYIVIVFTVTLLSIAFRTCTGWMPAVSPPSAQSGETS